MVPNISNNYVLKIGGSELLKETFTIRDFSREVHCNTCRHNYVVRISTLISNFGFWAVDASMLKLFTCLGVQRSNHL